MNGFRSALDACLEHFTSGLAREHAYEGTQLIVRLRVELFPRVRANALHFLSPPRPSCSSSFGHDTPAHVETSMPVHALVLLWLGSTECGSEHIGNLQA